MPAPAAGRPQNAYQRPRLGDCGAFYIEGFKAWSGAGPVALYAAVIPQADVAFTAPDRWRSRGVRNCRGVLVVLLSRSARRRCQIKFRDRIPGQNSKIESSGFAPLPLRLRQAPAATVTMIWNGHLMSQICS
jgi:hypothetical protein